MTPKLSRGSHKPNDGQTCVMEYISVITGDMFTDLPRCTEPMVAYAAQSVNDSMTEEGRQRLLELVPRLVEARPLRSDGVAELHCWAMFESEKFYRSHKDAIPYPYQIFLDGDRRVAGFLAKDITIHEGEAAGFEFLTRLLDERDRIAERERRRFGYNPSPYGYIDPRIEASMYAQMFPPTLSPAVLSELAAGHSVAAVAADEDK